MPVVLIAMDCSKVHPPRLRRLQDFFLNSLCLMSGQNSFMTWEKASVPTWMPSFSTLSATLRVSPG